MREEARRRVREAAASRMRLLAEREARLNRLAVDVVTAIAARDRAEQEAAEAMGVLLGEQVNLAEVGERCGLPVKEVSRLKRVHLAEVTVGEGPGTSQRNNAARVGDEQP